MAPKADDKKKKEAATQQSQLTTLFHKADCIAPEIDLVAEFLKASKTAGGIAGAVVAAFDYCKKTFTGPALGESAPKRAWHEVHAGAHAARGTL